MRVSKYFFFTSKTVSQEDEAISYKLMLRAGMLLKHGAGLYSYLPMALRALEKVKKVIREELDRDGNVELLMPFVQPASLWKESGRWEDMGPEMARFKDRKKNDYALSPTHEEVITEVFRSQAKSYKDLPISLYQIATKFRDEPRPRFGLLRGREFIMKDGYSFHDTQESLQKTYDAYYKAYCRIVERLGLKYRVVQADTGNMGGSMSHEFHVLAERGEDEILFCEAAGIAANAEMAPLPMDAHFTKAEISDSKVEKISTPGIVKLEELQSKLKIPVSEMLKAVAYEHVGPGSSEARPVVVIVRGDLEVSETKVKKHLPRGELRPLSAELAKKFDLVLGFMGPLKSPKAGTIYLFDYSTSQPGKLWVSGANEADYHFKNFKEGRDFVAADPKDLVLARAGHRCDTKHVYESARGIEVGHIFQLGKKYTEAMKVSLHGKDGKPLVPTMGCYGIGVSRLMAAAIEQNNDERGMVWPKAIAPFQVHLICSNMKNDAIRHAAEEFYAQLGSEGLDTLFDDRELQFGAKITDAELCGMPFIVVIGNAFASNGTFEVITRHGLVKQQLGKEETMRFLKENLL